MMRYDHTSTAFWLWSSSPATINKWCRHGKSHRNLWNDSRRWELGGWAAKRWLAPPKLFWLVVWNMAFIFPNSWDDDPIWLIFFRGVETTNQYCVCVPKWKVNADMLQLLVSDRRRPCWGGGCCEKISSLWRGCVMRCNEYIRVCICRYIYNYIYNYIYIIIYIYTRIHRASAFLVGLNLSSFCLHMISIYLNFGDTRCDQVWDLPQRVP